jgi:hypothetical protein
LCQFSKIQAEEFDKEIKFLEDSEVAMRIKIEKDLQLTGVLASKMFHLPTAEFNIKYENLRNERDPLLIRRILCLMLIDILKEYQKILKKIYALCRQCQSGEVALDDVEDKINEIILKNFIEAHSWFNSFKQFYFSKKENSQDGYINSLKLKLDKLEETNEMLDVDRIKSEMKSICEERDKDREARRAVYSGRLFGGKSSRTRSKKRKQMKMKMKIKSSNSHSKTRNNKQKYNGKRVKSKKS